MHQSTGFHIHCKGTVAPGFQTQRTPCLTDRLTNKTQPHQEWAKEHTSINHFSDLHHTRSRQIGHGSPFLTVTAVAIAAGSTAKRMNASSRHARVTSSRVAWPPTAWGQHFGRCGLARPDALWTRNQQASLGHGPGLFAASQQRKGVDGPGPWLRHGNPPHQPPWACTTK